MSEVAKPATTTLESAQDVHAVGASKPDTEDWEDAEYDNDGEADIDDEADAEAEEIARRLGDQLWADISRAQAAASSSSVPPSHGPPSSQHSPSKSEQAALTTMRAILAFTENDPLAKSTLATTVVPDSHGQDVLTVFRQTLTSGTVSQAVAKPLSRVLVTLARSDILFSTLRNSNASSIQLDKGKRKRTQADEPGKEGAETEEERPFKKPFCRPYDLQKDMSEAVHTITEALESTSSVNGLDSSLISSIQPQLHQVFLFTVTLSARGGPEMNVLKELSGLIQVISVLSGIQIGPPSSHPSSTEPHMSSNSSSWQDIGTAVYPCQIDPCYKVFSRLYSLRAHQHLHTAHRPFHCNSCPASFARNHDLKRHVRTHDRKAWKCLGCGRIFSRRDAIKRHKNNSAPRGVQGLVCFKGEILEVEVDKQEADDNMMMKGGRRTKLWSGIAAKSANQGVGVLKEDNVLEEGEIPRVIISRVQSSVTGLLGLLSKHVSMALGNGTTGDGEGAVAPAEGRATLASVIARVQLQNMPLDIQPDPVPATLPLQETAGTQAVSEASSGSVPSLSLYGLSEEQTKMLEQAIASAASAAQAQAEAEAAMEEDDEEDEEDEEDDAEVAGEDTANNTS